MDARLRPQSCSIAQFKLYWKVNNTPWNSSHHHPQQHNTESIKSLHLPCFHCITEHMHNNFIRFYTNIYEYVSKESCSTHGEKPWDTAGAELGPCPRYKFRKTEKTSYAQVPMNLITCCYSNTDCNVYALSLTEPQALFIFTAFKGGKLLRDDTPLIFRIWWWLKISSAPLLLLSPGYKVCLCVHMSSEGYNNGTNPKCGQLDLIFIRGKRFTARFYKKLLQVTH